MTRLMPINTGLGTKKSIVRLEHTSQYLIGCSCCTSTTSYHFQRSAVAIKHNDQQSSSGYSLQLALAVFHANTG